MTPQEIIESYVRDVARQLPFDKRGEVAAELRGLLMEHLAEQHGGQASADVALQLVRDFGRPTEVAARYHPPITLIEPSDTRNFLVVGVLGGILMSTFVKLVAPEPPDDVATGWMIMWFVVFALKAWVQRRDPKKFQWQPKPPIKRDRASWFGFIIAVISTGVVLWGLVDPSFWVNVAGAYVSPDSMAYDHAFRTWRLAPIMALIAAALVPQFLAAWRRGWTRPLNVAQTLIHAGLAIQLGWHGDGYLGRMFENDLANHLGGLIMTVIAVFLWLDVAIRIYHELGRVPEPATSAAGQNSVSWSPA